MSGIRTNIELHKALLVDREVVEGTMTTRTIERTPARATEVMLPSRSTDRDTTRDTTRRTGPSSRPDQHAIPAIGRFAALGLVSLLAYVVSCSTTTVTTLYTPFTGLRIASSALFVQGTRAARDRVRSTLTSPGLRCQGRGRPAGRVACRQRVYVRRRRRILRICRVANSTRSIFMYRTKLFPPGLVCGTSAADARAPPPVTGEPRVSQRGRPRARETKNRATTRWSYASRLRRPAARPAMQA